jgi:hypothetical protein
MNLASLLLLMLGIVGGPAFKAGAQVTLTWTGGSLVPTNLWSDANNWDALAVGLSNNWFTVPGSASTNRVILTMDPARGSVFYRMVYP